MKIYYNPKLKEHARELRKRSTKSEVILWNNLKGSKFYGLQFMRQKPIGEYIVDFYCSKLKLIIEIDGITHNDKQKYDFNRQIELESLGLIVFRFSDEYVRTNVKGVLYMIEEWIKNKTTP
jgi:very-short-patch-repair endonuclease